MTTVYFIECAGRIKIGTTRNLKSRVNALRTSAPAPLYLIATIPGSRREEADLHAGLHVHRVGGEWFEDCPTVREAISAAVAKHNGTFSPDVNAEPPAIPVPKTRLFHEKTDEEFQRYLTGTQVMTQKMQSVWERFERLAETPAFSDFGRAVTLERQLGVHPTSIIRKIFPLGDPVAEHRSAVATLRRCFDKFCKVNDRVSLAIMKQDTSHCDGLCRAAEVLIETAEASFEPLRACHRPIVNSLVPEEA